MKAYKEYKQSFMKENEKDKSFKSIINNKDKQKDSSILLSIDVQMGENNSKKFEINSFNEFDKKLNSFCEENNLSDSAKKYIFNSIMEQIKEKKYEECKNKLII